MFGFPLGCAGHFPGIVGLHLGLSPLLDTSDPFLPQYWQIAAHFTVTII